MREIKFRAWVPSIRSMGEPFNPFDNADGGLFPSDAIMMQYTGLKDKNGKEIYEGDALRSGTSKYTMRVEYKAPSFILHVNEYDLRNQKYEFKSPEVFEVIGNIYENSILTLSRGAIEELWNIGNNQPVSPGNTLSKQTAEELLDGGLAMHYDGNYVLTEAGKQELLRRKIEGAKLLAKKSAVNQWAPKNY